MNAEFSAVAHWNDTWDEEVFAAWARGLRARVTAGGVSLGLVFLSARWLDQAPVVLELLRLHAAIPLLIGCSGSGLIADRDELEEDAGIVVGLYHLPGATLRAFHLKQAQVDGAEDVGFWHRLTGLRPEEVNGWLVFADPLSFDTESCLRHWNDAWAGTPVLGGLASGGEREATWLFLDGEVLREGAVALAVGGDVRLGSMISQGCTPIGDTWTVTKVERNLIQSIGNRPAYEVLVETFHKLSAEEQQAARGNLFVGLVINEYLDEFQRGDFLVRNILGADPANGIIAVGAFPRPGQTLQFQIRAAEAATEDLSELLVLTRDALTDVPVYGACLCSCFGRGRGLFGVPGHDTRLIREALGPIGVAGFFCNGEIGPVGRKNFLHGYTASLALFVPKTRSAS